MDYEKRWAIELTAEFLKQRDEALGYTHEHSDAERFSSAERIESYFGKFIAEITQNRDAIYKLWMEEV